MFFRSDKDKEKKRVYGTRKYRKKLVNGIIASFILCGSIAVTNILPLQNAYAKVNLVDSRTTDRWEKVGHAYNNYRALTNGDVTAFAAEGADVVINPNSDGTYTVELTYNRQGVHSDSDNSYFNTSNPWYSFALSKGYDIVDVKTYSLLGKWSKSIGKDDLLSGESIYTTHEKGFGTAYWDQQHVGIKDLVNDAKAQYYSEINAKGIDKDRVGYFEKFNYSTSAAAKEGITKVSLKIKPNTNFVQGKEYVVANYKSYDWSKLFVSNTIVRDKEIKKDYKLLIEPKDGTLTLNKDLKIEFTTPDGKVQSVNLNDTTKKNETVIFSKILQSSDDTAYPFDQYKLTVDEKTVGLDGVALIEANGKKI